MILLSGVRWERKTVFHDKTVAIEICAENGGDLLREVCRSLKDTQYDFVVGVFL